MDKKSHYEEKSHKEKSNINRGKIDKLKNIEKIRKESKSSSSSNRGKSRSRSRSNKNKSLQKTEVDNVKGEKNKYLPNDINESNESEKKAISFSEEKEIPFSFEGYKTKGKGIINNFEDIPDYLDDLNEYTLFERKKMAEKYKDSNKYNIEQLLLMDQTNKEIQKQYLILAVKLINSEKDEEHTNILLEKIKKSGIILDENAFNIQIQNIKNKKYLDKIEYINYKKCFFDTLKNILNKKYTLIEAKNNLKIAKIYKFNQEANIGNNNYYFYCLCIELYKKLEEIFLNFDLYSKIITYFITFYDKIDLDNIGDNAFKYKYLIEILLDENSVYNFEQLNNIIAFLDGKNEEEENIVKAIKVCKKKQIEKDYLMKIFDYTINYDVKTKNLSYLITEDRKLTKKHLFKKNYIYNIKFFNQKISNIIKKEFDHNFLGKLFETVLPEEDKINELYENVRPEFNRIIKKILNSEAAISFFNNTYKKNTFKNLKYHFNKEDVQNKILENIIFAPIFNGIDDAITNATDLSIIISPTPYRFSSPSIPIYNREILNFGRLIIWAVHEILGHYLRRYYSYLTGQRISFNTLGDEEIDTGKESGFHIETEFLGFRYRNSLTLKNILGLLYEDNYSIYPIIKDGFELNENILKKIAEQNIKLFYFISLEEEDKNISIEKITINEYIKLININQRSIHTRIHCPGNYEDGLY